MTKYRQGLLPPFTADGRLPMASLDRLTTQLQETGEARDADMYVLIAAAKSLGLTSFRVDQVGMKWWKITVIKTDTSFAFLDNRVDL